MIDEFGEGIPERGNNTKAKKFRDASFILGMASGLVEL